MRDGISIVERMVLESLQRDGKTIDRLAEDIGLPQTVAFNSLSHLMSKNLVITFNSIYFINKKLNWSESINKASNLKNEQREILEGIVENCSTLRESDTSDLKIQKFWMNQNDINIFKSMLYNIEQFLKNLTVDSSEDSTKRQQIIFWGHSSYSHLANSLLN